jgi:hypothetical protein
LDRLAELHHEVKFVLPAAAVDAARLLLRGAAAPEAPVPAGSVETIYFDGPGLDALAEKRSGDWRKEKLRLRWYDGGGAVWVELKRRVGSRRDKRRALTGLDGARLSRGGIAGLGRPAVAPLACRLGEPLAGTLAPVVHLRYRRDRFVLADGVRINLDSGLEALGAATGLARRLLPAAVPSAVIEVKGAGRALPELLAALGRLGCRRRAFSKYAAALEAAGV